MPSFSIPLTGLKADSVALSTIGNNLANLNTTAFKKQDAQFADIFYQNVGSSGSSAPLQVGLGTRIASVQSDFAQGGLTATSNATDMAINGAGFFLVQRDGVQQMSRAGNFQLNPSGDLITSEGDTVMGYRAKNGSIDTSASLQPLNIPTGSVHPPQATSTFSFNTSLSASANVGDSFVASTGMYDSLGQQHAVGITFTKTATNAWSYVAAMPAGDSTTVSGNRGSLTFAADGTLATPTTGVVSMAFAGLADGAADLPLSWKLRGSDGAGLLTQVAGAAANTAAQQDGYSSGTYQKFTVDSAGVISASYSNNHTQVLGQLAVANVANPSSVSRIGGNLYAANTASGAMNIGVAGTSGRGGISDSSLEQSNVDISTEFADLIVAQRSFEANSKTVTAFDTITQDTINMIR